MLQSILLISLSTAIVFGIDCSKCRDQTISDTEINCVGDGNNKPCRGSTLTASDTISCTTANACYNAISLTATNDISCNGAQSCRSISGGITSTAGSVTCSGSSACRSTSIAAADEITCLGYACYRSDHLTATNDITCSGSSACKQAKSITSTAGNVTCDGHFSCRAVEPVRAEYISCTGSSHPCGRSKLYARKDIYMTARDAGYLVFAEAEGDIYITETSSARYGRFRATNIYNTGSPYGPDNARFLVRNSLLCQGDSSCRDSNSIRTSTDTLTVTFDGDEAGWSTDTYCPYAGDCTINCENNGCLSDGSNFETNVWYTKNTNVIVNRPECDPSNNDINNMPSSCPRWQKIFGQDEYNKIMKGLDEDWENLEEERNLYHMDEDEDEEQDHIQQDNDFMAYIEFGLQSGDVQAHNGLSANIIIGLIIVGFIGLVIAAFMYYNNGRGKYEMIQ